MGVFDGVTDSVRRLSHRPTGSSPSEPEASAIEAPLAPEVISNRAGMMEAAAATNQPVQVVRPIMRIQSAGSALPPEFNLSEINRIFTVDSYARQAVSRYIEFMFKQGWDFAGENPATTQYLKVRFQAMAEATSMPIDQLFVEMAEDLIKFHNCFVVKARSASFVWPKSIKVAGIYGRQPIVGLFVSDPTTFYVRRDQYGAIKQWEQRTAGGAPVKIRPEDVVHIPYQRTRGSVFGHPFLLTAREDIRALRQLEDLVLRMDYRYTFPFVHYQVGMPEAPATDAEIDKAWQNIEAAKTEGGLVTSERHKISAVALDRVIDVEPHLRYFESRVFTSIGVPEVLMGRGAGASRATSESLHIEFIDRVKAYQRVLESYINHFILHEMLLEGGFDPLLNVQDNVEFRFREVDFDSQIKRENHAIYKYEHNAVTEDEMRLDLKRNPITDRAKMFLNLVSNSKVAAQPGSTPSKGAPAGKGATGTPATGTPATNNKIQPTNQHAKQKHNLEPDDSALSLDEEAELLIEALAVAGRVLDE